MLTPYLRVQHHWHRETCCKNTNGNSRSEIVETMLRRWFLTGKWKGQLFITIQERSEVKQTACRENTQARNLKTPRPRGWIRSNTKIGPVLDAKIYPHEGRYCIDLMIESLFEDQTVSWVRIVNGIKKYVTETSGEISIENVQLFVSTERPVAKAKLKPKYVVNSFINVLIRERKWIDIDPQPFDHSCFAVSNFMIRLLRHEAILREDDGAVRFDDLIEKFKVKFVGTSEWLIHDWIKLSGERRRDILEVIS